MQERGELARHGHHRPFFRVHSPAVGQYQAPAAQITVGTEGTQDVLGTAHQEPAEHRIPPFGDPELGLPRAGLVLAGAQAKVGAHRAAPPKPSGILNGEHVAERGEETHPPDLSELPGLGILRRGHRLESLLDGANLLGEAGEQAQQGAQGLLDLRRELRGDFADEGGSRARRQATTDRFHGPADVIDELGSSADQAVASAELGEIGLGLKAAVTDRLEEGGIESAEPS